MPRTAAEPRIDMGGLASELESNEVIRKFLRSGNETLFPENCVESVKSVCVDPIFEVVKTTVIHMATFEDHPVPPIVPLRQEVQKLYESCGRQVEEPTVHADAWMLRKFISFLKMKVRRHKVSTAL